MRTKRGKLRGVCNKYYATNSSACFASWNALFTQLKRKTSMKKTATPRHGAFTLIEILVVLAIIGILAALLFPAFSRAQESARQTNCASNLNQIYIAVNQYYQDTRRYPDSLVDLLPQDANYDDGTVEPPAAPVSVPVAKGTDYLKGGNDILRCPDDDLDVLHSSYGALVKSVKASTPATLAAMPGRYVFNYWGYQKNGFALTSPAGVFAEVGSNASPLLRDPATPYNQANPLANPIKYSLSNRYAPTSTIITHCVYHRPNTANNLALPTDLYDTTIPNSDGTGARDIILRLDGTAKAIDVSAPAWNTVDTTVTPNKQPLWQIQQ